MRVPNVPAERLLPWLVLVAVFSGGCTGDSSGQTVQSGQTPQSGHPAQKDGKPLRRGVSVRVASVQARTVARTVDATGSLLAWQEVVLNTSVPGTVDRLLADLGDRVRAGQVVAELDKREFQLAVEQAEAGTQAAVDTLRRTRAQVQAAQANLQQIRDSRRALEANLARARAALAEAQANSERTRMLVENALVARRELEVANTQHEAARAQHEAAQVALLQYPDQVRVAEAELASQESAVRVAEAELRRREAEAGLARKKLADATLRAPIDGAVARRHVNPGEFLNGNTPVFTIVQSDPLKWSGTVAEHAALQVRTGQIVRLRADTVPGRTFDGEVTRVSPAVDMTSRTALLEARLPNREGLLKPGLFARGVIELRQDANVAFVPEAAVSYFAGITKVFVVADGTARERTVKLGVRRDGWVEVEQGVKVGETVAASGLGQLRDGEPVTVARAATPATAPR